MVDGTGSSYPEARPASTRWEPACRDRGRQEAGPPPKSAMGSGGWALIGPWPLAVALTEGRVAGPSPILYPRPGGAGPHNRHIDRLAQPQRESGRPVAE